MRAKYVRLIEPPDVKNIAARWNEHYEGKYHIYAHAKSTHENLLALGDNPTAEEINRVIGNKSWTTLTCSGCLDDGTVMVAIGEFSDNHYCNRCLSEAMEILNEHHKNGK